MFRNDPAEVASAFYDALQEPTIAGGFTRVVFAVWERDAALGNLAAFEARFGAAMVSRAQ